MDTHTKYKNAVDFLYSHIVAQGVDNSFPGELGLRRTKYLLSLLGNPQEKVKVIHIAGTSGKGSTAYYTSVILQALGKKVGLSVSPHLLDVRERFQIDGKLISEDLFLSRLKEIMPAIEQTKQSSFGTPTYFEVLTAFTYYLFAQEQVDYAIMEVGMGGLYDGTNVVSRPDKIAVVTRIGLDHTAILGKTMGAIARQKLGIVQEGNTLFYLKQTKQVNELAKKTVHAKKGRGYAVDGAHDLSPITLPTLALYQQENCNLALAVCRSVSERDGVPWDTGQVREALSHAHFKGRMDVVTKKGHEVIMDGAHNPQKMAAFIKSVKKARPGKKYTIVISIKKGKDALPMLRMLRTIATRIIYTRFEYNTTLTIGSQPYEEIREYVDSSIENPRDALQQAQRPGTDIIVTGSLYLVSALYNQV